ncbi:MAG TPA: DUF423 domain-containing protein [Stellaceae bacterium]|nr:DUF423 domain-containing protein [Stellaceae bacterium]
MERVFIALAALAGGAAVAADAAARHLLASDPYRMGLAATAARYGLAHGAALLAVALLGRFVPAGAARLWLLASGWCFVAALVLFCAPLYVLAAGLAPGIAALVPVGGTLFIAGWAALFCAAASPRRAG